jgi:3-hydroxyisobutyrate dehydrogenase
MKAFLGMGLLGSNFVKAMLKRGEQVQVWNRTASKAKEIEAFGAKAFANVTDAVRGAERIHLTLKDDASVDEVLQAASSGFMPGAIIIDHTTTSKDGALQEQKSGRREVFFINMHRYLWVLPMHWKVQDICWCQAMKN